VLLPFALDYPFMPATVNPLLQTIDFVEGGLVRLFQLVIRGGCFFQDAANLGRDSLGIFGSTLKLLCLTKRSQQEAVAFL
jgi:hypothetical protein